MNNTNRIARRLLAAGLSLHGTAALMGNLQAESALIPANLQNTYNQSLGLSDEAYTAAVDNGSYRNFVHDCAGYGLAQWTYWTRKQALLDFAKAAGTSIGDLDMQVDFLLYELKKDYPEVWKLLCSAGSVRAASDAVMCRFENPADQSEGARAYRAQLGCRILEEIHGMETESPAEPSGSPGKSVSELAREVMDGRWGNGSERRERLTEAGYAYETVQRAVNAMLYKRWTVEEGDKLSDIAGVFGISADELVERNGLLKVGEVLRG